jgi:zinc protease
MMNPKQLLAIVLIGAFGCAPSVAAKRRPAEELKPVLQPARDLSPAEVGEHLFHRRQLGNGLRAVAVRDEDEGVSVFVVVAAGKRQETAETTGLAHLTEHAMYTGTAKLGPEKHDWRIRELGGKSNAFTREDYTLFYDHRLPVANLPEVLAMEADRLRHLTFDKDAVLRERDRLTEEEAATWQPAESLRELVEDTVFQVHPYKAGVRSEDGHTLAPGLGVEAVVAFYDRYYQPNRAAVVVAGAVDPKDALDAIEEAFGLLPPGPAPEPTPVEPEISEPRSVTLPSSLPRDRLEWVWLIPAMGDPDRPALEVLAGVLSRRETSDGSPLRVIMGGRIDKELFRLVATGPNAEKDLEAIHSSLLSGEIDAAAVEEVKLRSSDTFTAQELRARPYFALAATVGVFEALGTTDALLRFQAAIGAVEVEDVLRVARRYLDPGSRVSVRFEGTGVEMAPLPEDPRELQRAAVQSMEAGELERSAAAFTKLLAHGPNKMNRAIYLSSRGQVRMQQRDYAGAIHDFESALELISYPDLQDLLEEARARQAGLPPEELRQEPAEPHPPRGAPEEATRPSEAPPGADP